MNVIESCFYGNSTLLWIKFCPLDNSSVEVLASNVTVFGDRSSRRKLRLNDIREARSYSEKTGGVQKEKEEREALFPDVHTPRKGLVGTQIRCQSLSQEDLSPEPSHTGTLISHFQPPELRENAFLLRFKSPSLWYLLFKKNFF